LPVDARTAADHLRTAVALSEDPADRARACVPLLNALTWTDDVRVVVGIVTDAIESVRRHDAELALRVEGELVTALRTGIATSPLADRRLESWRDRLEGRTAGERVLLVHLAVGAALLGDDAGTVETLARRALGGGRLLAEHSPESIVPYLPLYQLMCADRALDVVEESLGTALRRAADAGSVPGFAYASVFRSHLFRIRGRLADAEADAVQGLRATEALSRSRFHVAGMLDALVAVLLERGKLDEADAAIDRHGLGGDLPDSVPARTFIASRGHLRLAQGRTREGVDDLLHLLDQEERHGPASLFLTPYRSQAAVGLMQLGEPERAAALVDDALARARRWGAAPQLSTALRHAGLVHGGEGGLRLLAEAAAVVEGSPALLSRAWAGAELGSALRRAGRRTEARQVLRGALDLSHRCGAEPLAERAARELVLVGARPRRPALSGVESLTPGERRVCQLAAGGMTNREIAQALFVTLRTIEVHLTHAYQKLGIPSREHLPGVLASDGGPAGGATPPGPAQPLTTA
jgi:DNA-binding CsgD family transcriptional regulator